MVNNVLLCGMWTKQFVAYGRKIVEYFINDKKHFGQLVVTIGDKHTFLGMNINITEYKKVERYIKEQLLEAIEAFGENIDERVPTLEYSHLFVVNK